jgi:hypothetical protein
MPASFQGWEVVGLSNVTLDNGSGRCCLDWNDTEISEFEIRDKCLQERRIRSKISLVGIGPVFSGEILRGNYEGAGAAEMAH